MGETLNFLVSIPEPLIEQVNLIRVDEKMTVVLDYTDGDVKIFEMTMTSGQEELANAFQVMADELNVKIVKMI